MRGLAFLLTLALALGTLSGHAEPTQGTNLTATADSKEAALKFINLVTNLAKMAGMTNPTLSEITTNAEARQKIMNVMTNLLMGAEMERTKVVITNVVKMWEQNALPGLRKGEKGEGTFYPLTKEMQKDWVAEGYLDQRMADDVADCKYAYFYRFKPENANSLYYMFCQSDSGEVRLISAYQYARTNFVRLHVDQEPEQKAKQ
ncbi:MAG: hypothetical protein EPO07_19805 [Verrucomicrobia bacterium]|nr:MAG: hypothetical protein EPO07_19805 [Verrucomicrobiota bacterium]